MRTTLLLATAMLAAPTLSAQALNESFDYGTTLVFPPAGWSLVDHISAGGPGWEEPSISGTPIDWQFIIADAAGHDDFNSGFSNDASLVTPTMDLSSYPGAQLTFDSEVYYYNYMAHVIGSFGNGTSNVELSTDGGVTWASEWTETAQANGLYAGESADLSAYNTTGVEMRFHYFGDWAHCWAIDNVVVDNGGAPTGTLALTCAAGFATADLSGFTANGQIGVVFGPAGTFVNPRPHCTGVVLDLTPMLRSIIVLADANGDGQLVQAVGPAVCGSGFLVQAVDGATCVASNTVTL